MQNEERNYFFGYLIYYFKKRAIFGKLHSSLTNAKRNVHFLITFTHCGAEIIILTQQRKTSASSLLDTYILRRANRRHSQIGSHMVDRENYVTSCRKKDNIIG